MRLIRHLFLAVMLPLLLSSCGGGGGGGGSGNSISLNASSVSLVAGTTTGGDVTTQIVQVTFKGAGVVIGTLPGQTVPPWLSVTAGALDGNVVPISITADATGFGPGNYPMTLRFVTGNSDGSDLAIRDLPVTLTVVPGISPATVASDGVVAGPAVQTTITVSAGSINWVASTSAPWITLDRSTGTGTSDIVVSLAPGAMAVGDYTGTVTIQDTLSHASQVIPVSFGLDARRLLVRRPGVGLSLVGTQSRLSSSITVTDNGRVATGWSASADQAWLVLDKSQGVTDDSLGFTADVTGLGEGMHYARVTISPRNEPAVANTVVVRVGLYVNRAGPFVANLTTGIRVIAPTPHFSIGFTADPIRPYFYHSQSDGQIDIYDAYTAARVGAITIPGAVPGAMTTSLDGSRLFVSDVAGARIFPVDLDTFAVGTPFAARVPNDAFTLAYAEVSGHPVLVTSAFQAIDAQTGALLADAQGTSGNVLGSPWVAAQRDGRAAFIQGSTNGNHGLSRYSLSHRNGTLRMSRTHQVNEPGDGYGVALSFDDSRLYTVTPGYGYAASTLGGRVQFGPSSSPSAVTTSPNGNLFVTSWIDSTVFTYRADFTPIASYQFGAHLDALALSGDGHRLGLFVQSGGASRLLHFTDVP
ncbi:MAG: hypothetical protein K8R60_02055 [Burkholderiales bacterium]|nr:hypothetical protein [Burkholderiales bacterium]